MSSPCARGRAVRGGALVWLVLLLPIFVGLLLLTVDAGRLWLARTAARNTAAAAALAGAAAVDWRQLADGRVALATAAAVAAAEEVAAANLQGREQAQVQVSAGPLPPDCAACVEVGITVEVALLSLPAQRVPVHGAARAAVVAKYRTW